MKSSVELYFCITTRFFVIKLMLAIEYTRNIVKTAAETMTIVIEGDNEELIQPMFLVSCEIVFLTHIIRRATKEEISPVSVNMREPPKGSALSGFLNCPVNNGKVNAVTYKMSDLSLPFISYDEGMWNYFEPELTKRLAELDNDESTSARVRSVLSELLPGGQSSIEDVAERLGLSRRTLQRKLARKTPHSRNSSIPQEKRLHYIIFAIRK